MTKDHIFYDSIYMKQPDQKNLQTWTVDWWLSRWGPRKVDGTDAIAYYISFQGDKIFLKLDYSNYYTTL